MTSVISEKARAVKALVLDIDGVMTNGLVGYGDQDEIKFFHVRDGHGIKLAQRAGIRVGALSGRRAACNRRRTEELGFDFLYEGVKDKREGMVIALQEQHLSAEECAYIGDDVVDIPPMKMCLLGVAVADAHPLTLAVADVRLNLPGGHGAVREFIDFLLKEQGKWDELMQRYLS